jgi:S-adenosylmethionine hydrolase
MADSPPPRRLICLLTDFGLRDGYAGVMKGVIAGLAPDVKVIDLSHDVSAHQVRAAAFLLGASYRFFPAGSIHVVVVDPGVGSSRRGLVVEWEGQFFVGPDNGVLSPVLDGHCFSLTRPEFWLSEVSSTFHGRDVFSPVAAHLALGIPIENLGDPVSDPVRLETPVALPRSDGWHGEIVYADRFGNLVTNIPANAVEPLRDDFSLEVILEGGTVWPVRRTYSDVPPGELCAVVGGYGFLELSMNCGEASKVTSFREGSRVVLKLPKGQ